jgi:hypothetical protein
MLIQLHWTYQAREQKISEVADAERIMDANNYVDEVAVDESESVRVVRNLSLNYFRKKLIEHFNILFQHHELVWPSRQPSNCNDN